MVEIKQLIIKGKVNGEFNSTNQELVKIINEQIDNYISKYKFALSKDQKKFLIQECKENILKQIEIDSKL